MTRKKAVHESLAYLNAHRLDMLKTSVYTPEQLVAEEAKLNRDLKSLKG